MPIAPAEVVRRQLNSRGKAQSVPAPPKQAVKTGKLPLADRKDVPAEQAAPARVTWIGSSRIGSEALRKASGSRISSGVGVTVRLEFNAAGARRQARKRLRQFSLDSVLKATSYDVLGIAGGMRSARFGKRPLNSVADGGVKAAIPPVAARPPRVRD
jgi:hypothetical protein